MFYVLLRSSFRLLALAFVSKRPPQEQVKKIAQPNRYPGDIFRCTALLPGGRRPSRRAAYILVIYRRTESGLWTTSISALGGRGQGR